MNRQWWLVGGLVGLLLVLVGMGWFIRDRFAPVEVGTPAPDYAATDMDGRPVRLADLAGEVVLLNIWATWCPPCRDEMPSMQRLHEKLGPEGLKMVAVSIDRPIGLLDPSGNPGGDVREFVDELGLTFDIWLDPEGGIQQAYRTTAVPESFLIDRDGVIIKKVIGAMEWDSEANIATIRRLLGE